MSGQPLGSLFEQPLLISGDCLVVPLMDLIGVGVGKMRRNQANLEKPERELRCLFALQKRLQACIRWR